MPQIVRECPHCKAEKIGFAPRAVVEMRPGHTECLVFFQCEGCAQGLNVVLNVASNIARAWMTGTGFWQGTIMDVYPRSVPSAAPAHVPPQVCTAFLSGLDNLGRPSGANAAAIMFRRAIEVAVKIVQPDGKGDLKTRIAKLPDGIATPAMKDWAHHIRLDANDAAHEVEEYSLDDAKQLRTFSEMFLTYAFTLPEMLKQAQPPEPP